MKTLYNNDLSLEDYNHFLEEYKSYLIDNDLEIEEDLSIYDNNFNQWLNDTMDIYFRDELKNLDKKLKNDIVAIADLGLWNGRVKTAYKFIGSNLKNILYTDCDYANTFVKNNNVRSIQKHHDGTNYLLFRELKDEKYRDILEHKLYNNTITDNDISKYTKSLYPYLKDIYGY